MRARLCLLLVMGVLVVAPGRPTRAQAPALVRVGLLLAQESVTIGADGPLEAADLDSGRRETTEGGRLTVRPGIQGVEVGGSVFGGTVRLAPRAGLLAVNGRPYRGIIEIRRTSAGRVTVINELDLEAYLYGVVRSEMNPGWPSEALRAQAIAARSLAVQSAGRYASEGYDVRATTDSQVYGGVAAEDARTNAAVDATRGLVLLYDGRAVFAPFHTDSGGATESSEFVWGGMLPHLRGVADPHSREAPNHEWTLRLDLPTIEARLSRAGRPLAGVQRLATAVTSPSGRVVTLRVQATSGTMDIRGAEFRTVIGSSALRSTLFVVRPAGDSAVEFAGRGFGHGVGMSQWGARGLALAGRDHAEILRYYYTGVRVGPRP
ncbi:MAG: SpoIID/LytB domain-containing protein [Armatimonadota bacterium]